MLDDIKNVKIFIGGPTCARAEQRRIAALISSDSQIALRFRPQCRIDAQFWDAPDRKVLADAEGALQAHIDGEEVNPRNCHILLMYFKVPKGALELPDTFAANSFAEIDEAFGRAPPPRAIFIWEKFDGTLSKELTDEDIQRFTESRRVAEAARCRLKDALHAVAAKVGQPMELSTIDPGQTRGLEASVSSLLCRVIEELLKDVSPRTPAAEPQAEFEGYPYPGLRELGIDEGHVFFGHEKQRDSLLESLRADPDLRLIYIHGPSGAGKSSLLQAGLLHCIVRKHALKDRCYWAWSLFKPSENRADPFDGLVLSCLTHTNAHLPGDRHKIADELRNACALGVESARAALCEHLMRKLPKGGSGLIIAMNQCEELWSAASPWRDRFLNLIAAAESTPGIIVLATLRSDLQGAFTTAPQITPILQKRKPFEFALGAPGRDELIDMITKPAGVAGIKLHPSLAGTIAEQAEEFKDAALPVVAAMMQKLRLPDDGSPPRTEIGYQEFDAAGPLASIIAKLVER